MSKRVAAVSTAAHQLVLNNVSKHCGFEYFDDINYVGVAEFNPQVIYVGGWYVSEYSDWSLYQSLIGDVPKVIVHWYGSDPLICRQWRNMGQERMFEILRSPRFVHIPPNDKIKKEIESWLDIETTEPLNVPADTLFDPLPIPEKFTVGSYMPPERQDFFRIHTINEAMKRVKRAELILYHWLPPVPKIDYNGNHNQMRYAMNRQEYEQTVRDCSCLLRIPQHDAYSISAADFLMAGRPVISDLDLPHWPAWIKGKVSDSKVAKAINRAKNDNLVPDSVREFYRDQYDPSKFKARLEARCREKWSEFSFE